MKCSVFVLVNYEENLPVTQKFVCIVNVYLNNNVLIFNTKYNGV